jgi:hypothetical protein
MLVWPELPAANISRHQECKVSHIYISLFQYDFTFLCKQEDSRTGPIDCKAFLKDLDLERQVVEESG